MVRYTNSQFTLLYTENTCHNKWLQ